MTKESKPKQEADAEEYSRRPLPSSQPRPGPCLRQRRARSRTPRHPRPGRSSCSGRPAGYSTEPRPQPVTVCDAIRIHCRHNKKLGTGANTARWPGAHSSSGHRTSSRCRGRRAAEGELNPLLPPTSRSSLRSPGPLRRDPTRRKAGSEGNVSSVTACCRHGLLSRFV